MAGLIEPNQVGKREDLRDIMSVVDAKKYPITSMLPKGAAPKNSLVEWLMDNYPAPSFDGVLDGEDVTVYENMASGRARAQARVQLFRRAPMVSLMSQEVSDVAAIGQRQEMAKAIVKAIEMLKRDMECAFCSDHESQAQAGAAPYLTRGLGKWIQNGAQTDLPVAAAYRTPTASIDATATASLTEAIVNGVVQSVWDQTGEDKTYQLVCGRVLRARFSTFVQYQTASTNVMASTKMFTQDAAQRKITSTIDVLRGRLRDDRAAADALERERLGGGGAAGARVSHRHGPAANPLPHPAAAQATAGSRRRPARDGLLDREHDREKPAGPGQIRGSELKVPWKRSHSQPCPRGAVDGAICGSCFTATSRTRLD